MRRIAILVLMTGMAVLFSGCLGPLAMMAARGPEAVAKSMGQSAGYSAASNLAGSEIGRETVTAADTMANIDRILQEHPDAVNARELEEMKQRLAEDLPPPDAEVNSEGEALAENEFKSDTSSQPPMAPPASRHDRRSSEFATVRPRPQAVLRDQDIGLPDRNMTTSNRLRIEPPVPPDRRWRITDQHRFHSPEQTGFDEKIPTPAVQSLTGENYAPREMQRVMRPQSKP